MRARGTALRGALAGCRFCARNPSAAWCEIAGVEIVEACDLRADKPAVMAAAERLDFIDIVTTTESHRALVELFAAHGIAVVCQKPFARDLRRDDVSGMRQSDWRAAPEFDALMNDEHTGRNRRVKVHTDIDQRYIHEDFFAKLALPSRRAGKRKVRRLRQGARTVSGNGQIHRRKLSEAEAQRIGLVSDVWPAGELARRTRRSPLPRPSYVRPFPARPELP